MQYTSNNTTDFQIGLASAAEQVAWMIAFDQVFNRQPTEHEIAVLFAAFQG